jgi:hypothetical protein
MVDRVVTRAFAAFDGNVVIGTEGLPGLDCRKNCPSCCKLRVTATAPEIFFELGCGAVPSVLELPGIPAFPRL